MDEEGYKNTEEYYEEEEYWEEEKPSINIAAKHGAKAGKVKSKKTAPKGQMSLNSFFNKN